MAEFAKLVVENLIQQKSRLYIRQARMLTARTLQNLQSVACGLSRIPGRKTVVFMSEGFYVEESRAILETIAAQAARGGTAIYSIDGRGLTNGSSPNPDVVRGERARSTVSTQARLARRFSRRAPAGSWSATSTTCRARSD